jgi:replicative DNA helicase
MIKRRKIDNSIEESIITGLIISSRFNRDISPVIKPEYFTISYAQTIARWVTKYYKKYQEAPVSHIQDIYNTEKSSLKEDEADLISSFLIKLSDQLENETQFNEEYLYDKAIEYFKKRALKQTAEKISSLVELDRTADAEIEMQNFREVKKATSGWANPFSPKEVNSFFNDLNNNLNVLFSMPGQLGEMIGPFERNWLFAFLAPYKRGKSWLLQEVAIQAMLEKCKTVFISLEMDKFKLERRFYKRLTALDSSGDYLYPIFDCKHNQDGSCSRPERINKITLLDEKGEKPEWSKSNKYKSCTECRNKNKNYLMDTWWIEITRKQFSQREVNKSVSSINKLYGDLYRLKSYPAFSANLSQIKFDLDQLEYSENFIPDVIVIDYADILAPEDKRLTGRDAIDSTWKMLKNISDQRHCLVVTASQANRASLDKINVTGKDISEDIRKMAHVDGMIALNQSDWEKKSGVIRLAVIAERDGEFDQIKSCSILQNLKLGQPLLDSQIGSIKRKK